MHACQLSQSQLVYIATLPWKLFDDDLQSRLGHYTPLITLNNEQLQGVPYVHYFRTRTSCSLEAERPPASSLRAPPLGGGVQKHLPSQRRRGPPLFEDLEQAFDLKLV